MLYLCTDFIQQVVVAEVHQLVEKRKCLYGCGLNTIIDKKGVIDMPFKAGTYKHEEGFTIMVTEDGVIMLSPNHPLSLRLSVLFDTTKWTKIS